MGVLWMKIISIACINVVLINKVLQVERSRIGLTLAIRN